jgi:hypothetical protein
MGNGRNASPPGGPQEKAEIEAVLDRIARRIKELRNFDPSGIQDRWDTRLEVLQKNVNRTIADAVGMGSAQYRQLAIGPLDAALEAAFGDRFTLDEMRDELRKAVNQAVMRLNTASKVLQRRLTGGEDSNLAPLADIPASNFAGLSPAYAAPASNFAPLGATEPRSRAAASPAPTAAPAPAPAPIASPAAEEPAAAPAVPTPASPADHPATMNESASLAASSRIAIVGPDDASGEEVTRFVAQLGLEPVVAPPSGASLEGLEALRQSAYALVLQPDRQLEIGFLLGALGRSRICVLQAGEGQGKLPGLPHQSLDEGGLWKLLLAREMKKAGLNVDLNKAL